MKKIFKIALLGIIALVVVISIALIYFNISGVPTYEVAIPQEIKSLQVEVTPQRVARG